jgi:hypothetical protein
MNNYRRELIDPRSLQHNQSIVESTLDDEHYTREWDPQRMQISGGAVRALVGLTTIQWPCVTLPDAAASAVNGAFVRPIGWTDGKIEFRIHYTSSVGGVANFNLRLLVWSVSRGGSILTSAISNITTVAPGPAVAGDEKELAVLTTASITPVSRRFSWRLERDGVADANNNPLNLLHVVMVFKPSTGQ